MVADTNYSPTVHPVLNLSSHDERCKKCKAVIKELLEKIYGKVIAEYKFRVGTKPEDFKGSAYYYKLQEIYEALQYYRGFKDFVKAKTLPNCDYFVPKPGFLLELDESQHMTMPRKVVLELYPSELKLGFNRSRWIKLCEKYNRHDNDRRCPYRDEQRTWYETLRDFLPTFVNKLHPTTRLFIKDYVWCSLNPNKKIDIDKFKNFLYNKI